MSNYIIPNLFVLTFLILVSISCTHQDKIQMNNHNNSGQLINYLALGDSYTIGQGLEESERWPNQLGQKLEENGYEIGAIDIIAKTGWTTTNLINNIELTELGEFNLVSLLIGVNNQFQNKSFEIFRSEFDLLVEKSIQITGSNKRVFILSIPDYGVTPFGSSNSDMIAQELDMYNDYMNQRCFEQNISFVNITEISRQLADSPGSLAEDNLHPSGSQYAKWVEEMFPTVIALLEK